MIQLHMPDQTYGSCSIASCILASWFNSGMYCHYSITLIQLQMELGIWKLSSLLKLASTPNRRNSRQFWCLYSVFSKYMCLNVFTLYVCIDGILKAHRGKADKFTSSRKSKLGLEQNKQTIYCYNFHPICNKILFHKR